MEISRYASRLAPTSSVLPSGRPQPHDEQEVVASRDGSTEPSANAINFPQDLPGEPDDAHLTGGTRSLSRRLLALNFPALSAPRHQSAANSREASAQRQNLRRPGLSKSLAKSGLVA